jgi:hypothetical protein
MGLHKRDMPQTAQSLTHARRDTAKCPASCPNAPISQPKIPKRKEPTSEAYPPPPQKNYSHQVLFWGKSHMCEKL